MNNPEFDEYYNFSNDEYELPAEEFNGLIEYVEVLKKKLNELNFSVEENKKLQEENKKLEEQLKNFSHKKYYVVNQKLKEEVKNLREKNKELEEQLDGIMEDKDSQHIIGCNAYEKFSQAMCELNYDEEFITELKEENKKLKEKLLLKSEELTEVRRDNSALSEIVHKHIEKQ